MPVSFVNHGDLGRITFQDLYNYETVKRLLEREYINHQHAEIVKLQRDGSLGAIIFLQLCGQRFRVEGGPRLAAALEPHEYRLKSLGEAKNWDEVNAVLQEVVIFQVITEEGLSDFLKMIHEMGENKGREDLRFSFRNLLGLE